ncbi:MAG: SDR family NAD(P)-dependent oxidoreductase [Burkholderiales bacterium]|jgi:2-hydroxycyclohexanecarboxyl-CoA dehydrogenase
MDLGFKDRSVIVTGGASNIGRGIVLAFAAEGARITIGDIDQEQAEATAILARERGASSVSVVRADITNLDDAARLADSAETSYGCIDVLVNNAGWERPAYFAQQTPEYWHRVISINLMGTINCTKAVVDRMVPRRRGAIVCISSDASFGERRNVVYGAAKGGVNTFTKAIAKEYGRYGIRCNAVAPGVVIPASRADIGSQSLWAAEGAVFTEAQVEKSRAAIPLGKLGHAQDIAHAVLFFSSDVMAGHVSGQIISVSGGYATP